MKITNQQKKIIDGAKDNSEYNGKGKSRPELASDLIKVLKTKRKKQLVIILDEIDKLIKKERDHQEVLIPITDNTYSNIILISNQYGALDKLKGMIKSRLQLEERTERKHGI